MSKKTALVIFLLASFAVLIILGQSGKFRLLESRKRPFVIYEPSFKEVNSFSRPVIFLGLSITGPDTMDVVLNCLDGNRLLPSEVVNKKPKKDLLNAGIIGVRPDGKSFFVSVCDELVEFDSDFKIKKRIPLQEFTIKDNGYMLEFEGFGQSSNNYLWFGVREISKETENSISFSSVCLVEWEFNKPPSDRLIGNAQPVDWISVDAKNRKVFVSNLAEIQIYDFKKMEKESTPCHGFDFIDFDPNYGLLVSQTSARSGEKHLIVRYDFATGDQKVIAEGLSAVWGLDGYVYYCDTKKQLWQCSADGNDPIQFSSGIVKNINIAASTYNSIIQPPKISHDRTMLAYNFSYYGVGVITGGTALIDLKTREYIILDNEIFTYNQMAWLIKE